MSLPLSIVARQTARRSLVRPQTVCPQRLGQPTLFNSNFICHKHFSTETPVPPRSEPPPAQPFKPNRAQVDARGLRISTLFAALFALGMTATAVGLYQFYSSFTIWPPELRADLRAGIKAKNQDDLSLAERFLTRAYRTALSLPPSKLAPDPYLKLSGIAALLTEVVTDKRRAEYALEHVTGHGAPTLVSISETGLATNAATIDPSQTSKATNSAADPAAPVESEWVTYILTPQERLRRVAIACKVAELAHDREDSAHEEKWLVRAVEESLRLIGLGEKKKAASESPNAQAEEVLVELELPAWMGKADLGAPMEALGALYARKGNVEYAMPLYLQAISLLLPPPTSPQAANITVEDRCRAAQLMNNLSELIMRSPPSPEIIHQAESWARQALGTIERAEADAEKSKRSWFGSGNSADKDGKELCEEVLGVVLYNLGSLKEMSDDLEAARTLYSKSVEQCGKVGMREGIAEALHALRRVNKKADSAELTKNESKKDSSDKAASE
ncbi:hypothetical protein BJ138DRAFT_1164970 [Hygrophoropsis aurantiaca]|uniref:Uncharacterized protein n=1 Tax=Hygrophoropsis aurantiaca TaxID=72124 RepID=A0ACB7ZX78_9AGAM|nr:hypothetical protein BJ138DRAFT_1164970 [Hygrophoropsis aurantiaca]